MVKGNELAKMFSEVEEENERLYSTGSDELDNLLERAFCEGYKFAQREFAEAEEEEKSGMGTGAKAGIAAGGTVAAVGGSKLAGKGLVKVAHKLADNKNLTEKGLDRLVKVEKVGNAMQKPVNYLTKGAKAAVKMIKR